jgi:hypothetical protein
MKKILSISIAMLLHGLVYSQVVIDTFFYTGSAQTFTIEPCMGPITFEVIAGSGGDANAVEGGNGGKVEGTMSFTPGDVLYLNVGAEGTSESIDADGTYVGSGGVFSYSACGLAGTGGGASDIRLNGELLSDRIIVAGGGGGAGGNGGTPTPGGAGGGLEGGIGVNWPDWPDAGGKGGTQVAGGAQGIACCDCPTYTTDGSEGLGGEGSGDCAGGGGGGGGYYGGGGACFSGGGGGSSYTLPAMTDVTHVQDFQNGDGMIIIRYELYTPETSITIVSLIELMADFDGGTYQWIDCLTDTEIPGATNQNFVATENGTYAVIVMDGECTDTSDCVTISELSISESTEFNLTLSPNPFDDQFTIKFEELPTDGSYEIRDINGRIIQTEKLKNTVNQIAFKGDAGTYFIVIKNDTNQSVHKIIKK